MHPFISVAFAILILAISIATYLVVKGKTSDNPSVAVRTTAMVLLCVFELSMLAVILPVVVYLLLLYQVLPPGQYENAIEPLVRSFATLSAFGTGLGILSFGFLFWIVSLGGANERDESRREKK